MIQETKNDTVGFLATFVQNILSTFIGTQSALIVAYFFLRNHETNRIKEAIQAAQKDAEYEHSARIIDEAVRKRRAEFTHK